MNYFSSWTGYLILVAMALICAHMLEPIRSESSVSKGKAEFKEGIFAVTYTFEVKCSVVMGYLSRESAMAEWTQRLPKQTYVFKCISNRNSQFV